LSFAQPSSLSSVSSNRLAKGSRGGENGASGVVGQMKIWPMTRFGLAAARRSAYDAPRECETTAALLVPVASMTASASAAYSAER
jgi:hypothetical protein